MLPLILALIVSLAVATPTWAQDMTEEFSSDEWPEGWSLSEEATASDYDLEYDTDLYAAPAPKRGVYGQVANSTTKYILTPVVNGSGSLQFRRRNSSNGAVYIYVIDNGKLLTPAIASNTSKPTSWTTVSFSGVNNKRLAIVLNGRMDKFTYTPGTENPFKAPATLEASSIACNSAMISWAAGSGDESETAWNLEYKKSAETIWSEIHNLDVAALSYALDGLADNTEYDVRVKAIYGENESDWTSIHFKTPMAPITSFPWVEDFNQLTAGIPDGWDNAEGTTTNDSRKWNYYSSGGHDGGCMRFDSYYNELGNTNCLKTPVMNGLTTEMQLSFWYKNPAGGDFSIYISNDGGATYETEIATGLTGQSSWIDKSYSIPEGFNDNVVIVFKGTSNWANGDAYIYLDDVRVGTPAISLPQLTLGGDVVENAIDFGLNNTVAQKTIRITNSGKADMTNLAVAKTSDEAGVFMVGELTKTTLSPDEYVEVTVTFNADAKNDYNGVITVTADGDISQVITLTASYTDEWIERFDGAELPAGWEATSGWKIVDGVLTGTYAKGSYLYTPYLAVAEGESMTFKAMASSYGTDLILYYSKDGADYVEYTGLAEISRTDFQTYTIENLEPGTYRFRINTENLQLDDFVGFHKGVEPAIARLSVYADAEATVAGATNHDFGFLPVDADASSRAFIYYIKNTGTSTSTLTIDDSNFTALDGFAVATEGNALTVAPAAVLKVTITMTNVEGLYNDRFTLTTNGGNFDIDLTGFVYGSKYYVNFAAEDAKFPAKWQTGNWTIADGAAKASDYSASDLQTYKMVVAEGEKLYVEAKYNYYSGSLTYSSSYEEEVEGVMTEQWTEPVAIPVTGDYKVFEITGIPAGTRMIRFNGKYVSIRRIYGCAAVQEPIMTSDAADYDFGNVAEEALKTFTVTNDGNAELTGLKAVLAKGNDYAVAIEDNKTSLAAGESATITLTQKYDAKRLGAHSDVLTISADAQDDIVVNLTGTIRDASKYYVEAPVVESSKFSTPALTIAAGETLTFDVKALNGASLSVSYTTDGGMTWNTKDDYELSYGDNKGLTLSFGNIEEVTAWVVFNVKTATLTNVYGGVQTTAPMIELTKADVAIANNDMHAFGSFTTDQTVTYVLKNVGTAPMDYVIATEGDVTVDATEGSIAVGDQLEMTATMKCEAPFGAKTGKITIQTAPAEITLHINGTAHDATAFMQDFASDATPAGWYNGGWTVTDGQARVAGEESDLITELIEVKDGEALSFDAKWYSQWSKALTVSYSTDRKQWTAAKTVDDALTADYQTFTIDDIAAGSYYLKFTGKWACIDNLIGGHKTEAPAHDIYVATSHIPTADLVPASELTATVDVASLRADEEVTASLYFGGQIIKSETLPVVSGTTETISITATVPETEGVYEAYIQVTTASGLADQTAAASVKVAHIHALQITSFTRKMEEEESESITANAENKFSAAFTVNVQNTGSAAENIAVKVLLEGAEVGVAVPDAVLLPDGSVEVVVMAQDIPAGEGGDKVFSVEAYIGEQKFTTAATVTIPVIAAAPKFAIYQGETAVENNAAIDFGISSEQVSKTYTIKNEGNAPLTLNSIVAPEGFTIAPELTDDNRVIAVDAALDITLTTTTALGKKQGDVVINYQIDANTAADFTLAVSARTIAEGTWVENFDGDNIPAGWLNENSNWRVSYDNAVYCSNETSTLTTPLLTAAAKELFTFEVVQNNDNNPLTVEVSSDRLNWNAVNLTSSVGEKSFRLLVAGNYYVRFSGKYIYLDNFIGWKKAEVAHDMIVKTVSIPATATVNNKAEATVNVQELLGKTEQVTASLYIDGQVVATETKTVEANASGFFTLSFTPHAATDAAVKAYIEVSIAESDYMVKTAEQDFIIEAESGEAVTLTGSVKEYTEQPIADAAIIVKATKSDGTEVLYTTTTAEDGSFSVDIFQSNLLYTITVEQDGQTIIEAQDITDLTAPLDIVLYPVGIRNLTLPSALQGQVYTLDGVRVLHPRKGQLYIVNGKKIIIK
ncbi:MAG: choice-of-anchor D domain-containing protein [Bacteroidaceae bacterium]|nr:choice-of-anchor D domain-containing protein [Bacteroidaceae bacterium]